MNVHSKKFKPINFGSILGNILVKYELNQTNHSGWFNSGGRVKCFPFLFQSSAKYNKNAIKYHKFQFDKRNNIHKNQFNQMTQYCIQKSKLYKIRDKSYDMPNSAKKNWDKVIRSNIGSLGLELQYMMFELIKIEFDRILPDQICVFEQT